MKWVTRARPKTDRIACPWLIRRFIDPDAEIVYVAAGEVLATAEREGGYSFDAPGLLCIGIGGLDVEADDHRLLERASFVYDALYAWCQRDTR
ncbi:MAG: chromate resistance protein [Actinomycetota bacterium]|nr:chromate resistance protein [Actinomycetota bacterium]